MLIKEVISSLKLYAATVRVPTSASANASKTTIQTAIHAESAQHARQLLDHLYGANSVSSLILVTKFQTEATAGAAVGPLSADQLKLKALTDQKRQLAQREKQERARQQLVKAQAQVVKSRQARPAGVAA